jgi:hypothetical protein
MRGRLPRGRRHRPPHALPPDYRSASLFRHHPSRGFTSTMRIPIFGASGRTGGELVRQALERAYTVSAFTRIANRVAPAESLNVIVGDVGDKDAVSKAVAGHDAVVSVLGVGRALKHDQVVIDGVGNIVSAMAEQGVRRLVYQSFIGVPDSRGCRVRTRSDRSDSAASRDRRPRCQGSPGPPERSGLDDRSSTEVERGAVHREVPRRREHQHTQARPNAVARGRGGLRPALARESGDSREGDATPARNARLASPALSCCARTCPAFRAGALPPADPIAATACRDRRFGVRSASQHARRTAHRREFDLLVRSDKRS